MSKASLSAMVDYCQKTLRPQTFTDSEGAVNGLQVENSGQVTKIAATVDASLTTVKLAIAAKADLLIIHHGLFWNPTFPWTGKKHEMIKLLVENDLAVYSSHLPLDAHPRLGNNAVLCAELGLKNLKPFFQHRNSYLGWKSKKKISRQALSDKLAKILGTRPHLIPGGDEMCQNIGICSGGCGENLKRARDEGVDTFITGEGPHWSYAMAEDLEMNVFYGGHYLTETLGPKALAAELSKKFRVPWVFLDHPTGL